jgi:hypothetical protein
MDFRAHVSGILFCKIKMSTTTTNEPDLTQILDAIKLLVTSEGKIFGFIASCADLAIPPNRNLACTTPKNCGINFPGIILVLFTHIIIMGVCEQIIKE